MQIWQMEPFPCGDRRLPHHMFPPKKLNLEQLTQLTGVQYYKVDLDDTNQMKKRISRVKNEKNVSGSDIFVVNNALPDLNDKLDEYYEPVSKSDDVVALIMEGSCYYDVELEDDEWIRIHLEKGDLICIPKGLSHRFTVTPSNAVTIQRFFPKKPEMMQG